MNEGLGELRVSQTLFYCRFAAAYGMGNERNPICPTHRRCNFRSNHCIYGVTPSSGIVYG